MSKRVAVLMGGWSVEREVSLSSGTECAKALHEAGYDVYTIDVDRALQSFLAALLPAGHRPPDVIFNALHGKGGEDGMIQGLLDYVGIPYTHSGVLASAVAMHKELTRKVLQSVGIAVPEGLVMPATEFAASHPMDPPYVVKPVDEGSSVGVRIVSPGDHHPPADDAILASGSQMLVERYIPGRELTVGVMGDPMEARAMTVTEIRPAQGFYDYAAKYTDGLAIHDIPAQVPAPVIEACLRSAELAHVTLGCRGVSRSDFRFDDRLPGTDGLFLLEVNTQPGMTPLSLVPEQAAHLGMSFAELCSWIVEAARCPA